MLGEVIAFVIAAAGGLWFLLLIADAQDAISAAADRGGVAERLPGNTHTHTPDIARREPLQ